MYMCTMGHAILLTRGSSGGMANCRSATLEAMTFTKKPRTAIVLMQ